MKKLKIKLNGWFKEKCLMYVSFEKFGISKHLTKKTGSWINAWKKYFLWQFQRWLLYWRLFIRETLFSPSFFSLLYSLIYTYLHESSKQGREREKSFAVSVLYRKERTFLEVFTQTPRRWELSQQGYQNQGGRKQESSSWSPTLGPLPTFVANHLVPIVNTHCSAAGLHLICLQTDFVTMIVLQLCKMQLGRLDVCTWYQNKGFVQRWARSCPLVLSTCAVM